VVIIGFTAPYYSLKDVPVVASDYCKLNLSEDVACHATQTTEKAPVINLKDEQECLIEQNR
jgi:hypothetical protein